MVASAQLFPRLFAVTPRDGVMVITFIPCDLVDDETVRLLGLQLFGLLEGVARPRVVLDFAGVTRLSSALLGTLVTFSRKIQEAGGCLLLCSLAPWLSLKFESTRLNQLFRICPDEPAAVRAMPACGA